MHAAVQGSKEPSITDKVFTGLATGAIPVYLGNKNIRQHLPHPDAVIMATDFADAEALAAHITRVSEDAALYASYMQWNELDVERMLWGKDCADNNFWYCQVCERVAYLRAKAKSGTSAPEPWGGNKIRANDAEAT